VNATKSNILDGYNKTEETFLIMDELEVLFGMKSYIQNIESGQYLGVHI